MSKYHFIKLSQYST
ncbi:hypothetical protein F383_34973 [Gossypium arboreum]|uniref:Uncharacterized protein n=1 Tax=Gossypium arboreum TaxID=29729 RepID=A0A0B0N584_GOSAR|nr:hypothetical protein F383_34973 [Gossypium arboreum]